jgi:hypothetical protein
MDMICFTSLLNLLGHLSEHSERDFHHASESYNWPSTLLTRVLGARCADEAGLRCRTEAKISDGVISTGRWVRHVRAHVDIHSFGILNTSFL